MNYINLSPKEINLLSYKQGVGMTLKIQGRKYLISADWDGGVGHRELED